MSPPLLPFQLVLHMFAGWVNRHQLDVIEYLLIALEWTYRRRPGAGRPRVMKTIVDLVMRMGLENPSWDTRASKAHWPIWDIRLDAARLPFGSRARKDRGCARHRAILPARIA
jgi:hypothetical protein